MRCHPQEARVLFQVPSPPARTSISPHGLRATGVIEQGVVSPPDAAVADAAAAAAASPAAAAPAVAAAADEQQGWPCVPNRMSANFDVAPGPSTASEVYMCRWRGCDF